MRITPPYGYGEVTPLLKTHRVVPAGQRRLPDFVTRSNALPVSLGEVAIAAHHYPVVFTLGPDQKSYSPVVILGISVGENLFVRDGAWLRGVYLPAYVRRHPFCMTRVLYEGALQSQRVVCVETDQLRDDGEPLFDMAGQPLPVWAETNRLLSEFEADLDRTIETCAILRDFKLLEPFNMQASFKIGGAFQLDGMLRVDEKRLEALSANELKTLIRKGILGPIYQHLGSLTNFNRLIDLKGEVLLANPPLQTAPA